VISIGNLTVGGSGKTPLTIWLAKQFLTHNTKVAILTRGYGRKGSKRRILLYARSDIVGDPEVFGDEPLLIASTLQSVPVVVGRDRYQAGRLALEQFGIDVCILDDGFQHLKLDRTIDIVLIAQGQDLSRSSLLPRGILREPLRALKRADIIILTEQGVGESGYGESGYGVDKEELWLRRWNSKVPIFHASLEPDYIYHISHNTPVSLHDLKGKTILAFCGIARPERFFKTLEKLGIAISCCEIFPDHHRYTSRDLALLREHLYSLDYAITTEKDAVKLRHYGWTEAKLLVLTVSMVVHEQEAFWTTLQQGLGSTPRISKGKV
jgi:tetraacyldisaccharide 4'-kinase